MLEIQGLRNKVNNIEAELKELGALTISDSFFILKARTAIIQAELMLNILEENLKELRRKELVSEE
jgi:hypothetical protein